MLLPVPLPGEKREGGGGTSLFLFLSCFHGGPGAGVYSIEDEAALLHSFPLRTVYVQ